MADIRALPDRLDDEQLALVEHTASLPLPPIEPMPRDRIVKSLNMLNASLPRAAADEKSGSMRLSLYREKLSHLPEPAFQYACDKAVSRCDWFPTIKQLLDFAAEWTRDDAAIRVRAAATSRARRERNDRMDDLLRRLAIEGVPQPEIDALPERMKTIAETRGLLWLVDGEWRQRPQHRPEPSDADPMDVVEQFESGREAA